MSKPSSSKTSKPRTKKTGQERFSIGTFNLYKLASPGFKFFGDEKYNEKDYKAKIAWVSNQLENMNADIVGFQEVFNVSAIEDATSKLYKNGHHVFIEGTPQGAKTGLVSRFPILSHEVIELFPQEAQITFDGLSIPISAFSRPVIKAVIAIPSPKGVVETSVFVTHLKSKRPKIEETEDAESQIVQAVGATRSLMIRAAETTAIRALVVKALKGNRQPAIVVGDVNDTGNSVTSEILAGSPPFRFLPLEKKKAIWDVILTNVKDIQSRQSYQDYYYTHIHNGQHEAIDHLYVSNEFVATNPTRLGYVEYLRVFNDHLIDKTLSGDRTPKTQSDHGQAVVTIRFAKPGE
jgi:endonuclease/exonuclease/phosphatase family metal-dependent hydrolase